MKLEIKKTIKNILETKEKGTIIFVGLEGLGILNVVKEAIKEINAEKIIIENEKKFFQIATAYLLVSLTRLKTFSRRIIVIDSVDKFQKEAQNTLLKTLEEPLSNTFFILITSKLFKILPTIRSRSIIFRFPPSSKKETFQFLKKENFSKEDIDLVLKIYPYEPIRALELLQNKEKINLLKKFFNSRTEKLKLIEEISKNFTFQEFVKIYLLYLYHTKQLTPYKAKELLNLYFDSDFYLNETLQLANLVLNYG